MNSFCAELWALRDGLLLCQQMNMSALIVELDAKALVEALTNPSYSNTIVSGLYDDCKQLLSSFPHCRIQHAFREANMCADQLARIGLLQESEFVVFPCPPMDIKKTFEADSQGLYSFRLCPELSCSYFFIIFPFLPKKKASRSCVLIVEEWVISGKIARI